MDAEQAREFLLGLPHVTETVQWGGNLVFWAADKAIGGKMFAVVNLDCDGRAVLSFAAGPERYAELLETDGVIPAPYLARAYWVSLERWEVFSPRALKELLAAAQVLIYEKLSRRTEEVLAMAPVAQRRLLADRKKLLAGRAASAKQGLRDLRGNRGSGKARSSEGNRNLRRRSARTSD